MEGMQSLRHRVIDGVYGGTLLWKIQNGAVYVRERNKWTEVDVPIWFMPDFAPTPVKKGSE